MIKYPNGKVMQDKVANKKPRLNSAANRGMGLEADINLTNEFYLNSGRALITKRPTPINVVKVDYARGAKIVDAYFEKQSTTDYNGVYRGKYIDFEAKSTTNKTSFPFHNIYTHQLQHLKNVLIHGGLCFFIIEFALLNQIYLIDAKEMIELIEKGDKKSVPLGVIKEKALLIETGLNPRVNYLDAVDQLYF